MLFKNTSKRIVSICASGGGFTYERKVKLLMLVSVHDMYLEGRFFICCILKLTVVTSYAVEIVFFYIFCPFGSHFV